MIRKIKERYEALLGEEKGTICKTRGGRLTVALVYPNLYQLGMSNLGLQKVYSLFNQHDNILCERFFLPPSEEIALIKKNRLPLLSLESQTPLNKFDLIAFSLSFETDYLHIPEILSLAHIPLLAKDRKGGNPLVIAGGICVTFNPEPLADFVDLFLIGEGEELVPEFIQKYLETAGQDRSQIIKAMSDLEGIYVPSNYEEGKFKEIRKRFVPDLNLSPTSSQIITSRTTFENTFLIEVGRGCGRHCSFCVCGHIYSPDRYCSYPVIMGEIKKGLKFTPKIGLIGAAISDHPRLDEICRDMEELPVKPSVSSLRLDAPFESLIRLLGKTGCKSISLAPETGSLRLRKLVNKNITDEKILEAVALAIGYDILNIKLYFLIGLPQERPEDIEAIGTLVKKIRERVIAEAKKNKRLGQINLSINPFVPKPFTPFERMPMDEVSRLNQKIKMIRKSIGNLSNVNLTFDSARGAFVQALLSRGDRKVGRIIAAAMEAEGDWARAIRESGIDPSYYVHRQRAPKEVLPWGFIK